ncbi:phage tail protein [Prosthecodimorpha hirschii]|uniref:phage tail protein n=1 Tax=Prosthecodimorpha hirschii TaxID=665126 RepID=UPI0015E3FC45|nr:phage tail protein [Prosthecomicrobium hirschii]
MTVHIPVLPANATDFELALAAVLDPHARLADAVEAIRAADHAPPVPFLPYLVWEYGLGEVSPYVPNIFALLAEGVRWQRVRSTRAAIDRALTWLGYAGTLEWQPTRRRWWNGVQLALGRFRDAEEPDLDRIEGLMGLSLPFRSDFLRGHRDYDVRAAETGWTRTSACMLSDWSGARLHAATIAPHRQNAWAPKWSFGREWLVDQAATQADLTALGVWVEPGAGSPLWSSLTVPWAGDISHWTDSADVIRRRAIATALDGRRCWVRFEDTTGIIGHARARVRAVAAAVGGEYRVAGQDWTCRTDSPTAVLVSTLTRFGDGFSAGAGRTATRMGLLFDAAPIDGLKPAIPWAGPDVLAGGLLVEDPPAPDRLVAETACAIPFGRTVREQVRFLLRL